MKAMMVAMFFVLCAAVAVGAFFAGSRYKEVSISQACDDKTQEQTTIAGHVYFCDDYDHAHGMINYLIQQANKRGA